MSTFENVHIGDLLREVRDNVEGRYLSIHWTDGWYLDCVKEGIKPYSISALRNYVRYDKAHPIKVRRLAAMLQVVGLSELLDKHKVEAGE